MSSTTSHPSDGELAGLLVAASVQSGRPAVPPGRRDAVVSLLAGLMADGQRLDAYAAGLKAKLESGGLESRGYDGLDVDERDDRIATQGFSWLPDEELAALALSPQGLEALYELLEDPETATAGWFMDAMMAAHAQRPEVLELESHARRRIARLLGDEKPTVLPITAEPRTRGWAEDAYRWGGKLAPLAASLLVGVLLGTTASRNGGEPSTFDVTATSAPSPTRGSGEQPGVKVESGLDGFVAVVALAPGRRPQVIPDLGVDDVPVRGGFPAIVQVPESTVGVLSVVTETPASEPLRRALREKTFDPGRLDELKAFVKSALEAKGYRRMALVTVSLGK